VTGRSLDQRSPTECGVPECDLETSTMSWPRPTRAVEHEKFQAKIILKTCFRKFYVYGSVNR